MTDYKKELASENKTKPALLAVRLPEEELAAIEQKAADLDLKKSTYVRLVLREKRVMLVSKDDYKAEEEAQHQLLESILHELRRIGEVNPKLNFGTGSAANLEEKLNEIKDDLVAVSALQLALLTPADDE